MTALPATPEPADHEMTEIGAGKYEYRGHFISKTRFDREYTVLEPAPSNSVFCYRKNLWDVEDAIDAFLDHGIDPWGEEEVTGTDPAEWHWPNNWKAV